MGRIIEYDSYSSGGEHSWLQGKTINIYDEENNLVESDDYGEDDSIPNTISTFKYQDYDKKGNWLKRIEYRDETPFSTLERIIEYY